MEDSTIGLVVKILAMFLMFCIIGVFGSIPLRMKSFKANPRVLSYSKAFSGGLFLSVGLIHLLPEANENFAKYFAPDDSDHFPFAFLTVVLSFSLVLCIEKIVTDHHHAHGDEERKIRKTILNTINRDRDQSDFHDHHHDSEDDHGHKDHNEHDHEHNHKPKASNLLENPDNVTQLSQPLMKRNEGGDESDEDEEAFKNVTRTVNRIAKKMSFVQNVKKSVAMDPKNSHLLKHVNTWAPFILQIAIGIHAVFEGLAIGIETDPSLIIGISIAVVCHKWAEGLTLGLAFADAGVDLKTSTIMIFIQAIMNPIGIGIGWGLSNQGDLITAIFESISAGTFVYIATAEVIVEEFSISRYKVSKFCLFLVAVGFVSSLWFIEQATGG